MSRTDLIADAFTVIRNAYIAKKDETLVPHSKIMMRICEILKNEGYLENFSEIDLGNFKKIKVYLRYANKKSVITEIKRVSRPGRRVYLPRQKIPRVLQGYGTALVSTSHGVMTDKEAREKGLGGEIMGMIW